jgi:endonuclease/exonuclease/phosphatase family metal-dependent hydrolase
VDESSSAFTLRSLRLCGEFFNSAFSIQHSAFSIQHSAFVILNFILHPSAFILYHPPMARLTLVTFNIAHGRGLSLYQGFHSAKGIRLNLARIGAMLAETKADIVALQEVDEDSHWNQRINLLQALGEVAGFPHAYLGVNNRRWGRKPLAYGNAILSRHPVRFWENNPFGTAMLGEKGFLYAEVEVAGHALPIINLHLDYRSRARRILQVKQVIEFLRCRPHPDCPLKRPVAPIICGDFNTHSRRVGDAVRHLFDALLTHGEYEIWPHPLEKTFPAHLPSRGLDFIFLPKPYRARRCEVPKEYLSDHCPVVLEIEFEG